MPLPSTKLKSHSHFIHCRFDNCVWKGHLLKCNMGRLASVLELKCAREVIRETVPKLPAQNRMILRSDVDSSAVNTGLTTKQRMLYSFQCRPIITTFHLTLDHIWGVTGFSKTLKMSLCEDRRW